jgi:tetratricopeptide (TPR) repeat protein
MSPIVKLDTAWFLLLSGLILFTSLAIELQAHESPEHEIERLTQEMKTQGVSAERLFRRALEYRSMRRQQLYEQDLTEALELDPQFFPARIELAKWKSQQQKSSAAREIIEPLTQAEDRLLRAVAIATRAEIEMIDKNWDRATTDFTTALKIRPDVQWFLQRAESQSHSQDWAELLAGLRDGYSQTQSPVLLRELCDRLLDIQEENTSVDWRTCQREAMQIIEQELEDSRFQSSWLTRRARLRIAQADQTGAAADLSAAITELQNRMSNHHPDPQLVAELSAAKELLTRIRD